MELRDLITLYRRWFWLLILGFGLGLASGYAASKIQIPVYEVSTKALVTRSRQPSSTDILTLTDQQLVLTYQQLLKTRPVLDDVESRLGIQIDPDTIKVDIILNTQILQLKVQNEDPQQAVAVANTLIEILIEQNESLQAGRYSAYEDSLNSQIVQAKAQIEDLQHQIDQINKANIDEQLNLVNQQINDLQVEISTIEQEIAGFPVYLSTTDRASLAEKQSQLDQLRSLLSQYQEIQTNLVFIGKPTQGTGANDLQVTSLQATLSLYQQLYLGLLNNLEAVKLARAQSTPTVTQIEVAAIPEKPVRPIPLFYTALSAIVGLLIAAGAILLIDYFDDTLKSAQKIQEVLGIPVIGEITETGRTQKVIDFASDDKESSMLLNSFGVLRINVGRLLAQNTLKTILVTSPSLGEGKTTIAAHLAEAFMQSGKKVVLIDADFRHSSVHSRLGLENQTGLADILSENLDWQVVSCHINGLTVITSGTQSSSSAMLFESDKMTQLLEKLEKKVDLVILDGPPLFVMDAQILASQVGGILLVIRQGNTLTTNARAMINQLDLLNANLLGVVLNRVKLSDTYYPNGYYYNGHKK